MIVLPNSVQHNQTSVISAPCGGVRKVPRTEPAHVWRIQPAVYATLTTHHEQMLSSEVNTAEMDTIFTLYRRIIRVYSRYGGALGSENASRPGK